MLIIYFVVGIYIVLNSGLLKKTLVNNKYVNGILLLALFILFAIGIYNVNINDFTDLNTYNGHFQLMKNIPFNKVSSFSSDPLFAFFMWVIANLFGSFKIFLLLVWVVIFRNYDKTIKLIFGNNETVFVFFSFINYFIFFNYVLNVIRQGLAVSFLILAVAILINGKEKSNLEFYFCIIAAPLFHNTALYGSLIIILLKFYKINLNSVIKLWLFFILLFMTGFNRIFSFLPVEDVAFYTSGNVIQRYGGTNRLDFLLFSVFFGIFAIYLYKRVTYTREFEVLLKYYLLMNILYLALGFIAYSDRLAGYSWLVIPLLMWKGIENARQYRLNAFLLLNGFIVFGILMGSLNNILSILIGN